MSPHPVLKMLRTIWIPAAALGGFGFLGLFAAVLVASTAPPSTGPPPAAVTDDARPRTPTLPDHRELSAVLEGVVEGPRVDYRRLSADPGGLDRYIASLDRTGPAELEAASRDEQLAFWINAYNACMLRLVVEHYPIRPGGAGLFQSIRNRLAGYPENSVWQIRNVFTRSHCPVAGADRSQDEIEHEIIRPRFGEPRIHFAVNCAAISCPVLRPEAYTGAGLDEELDRAVRGLMDDPAHFRLERGTPATLHLNKVLDWYREDFGGVDGLKRFFADYLEGEDRGIVLRPDTRVTFFEYDWTLNDVER